MNDNDLSGDESVKMLCRDDIGTRMDTDGFPEMAWLWQRFVRLDKPLASLDPDEIAKRREKHMGVFHRYGWLMAVLGILSACGFAAFLKYTVWQETPAWWDWPMAGVFCLLGVYLVYFILTLVYRSVVNDWKAICSLDLAQTLRWESFRQWHAETESSIAVEDRLSELGVMDWDNPEYKVWYKIEEGQPVMVEKETSATIVQNALRKVLGYKEDRQFKQGQYFSNLTDGKKSVSRFVKDHQEALASSREGRLEEVAGIRLLSELAENEMCPGTAGMKFLQDTITALKAEHTLPKGVVEAYVWDRDPWVDLTRSLDFYSSASLRGNGLMDSLERRSKGMLGPFGYLHNKSISCLDFKTSEGRYVRARMAAACTHDSDGKAISALFVDAVEGRLNINPALIRQAIEDYAKACHFDVVLYHRYPLNRVPLRFVTHLGKHGLKLGRFDIEYLSSDYREYLDVFGLPIEPFEYARPKGRVMAYITECRPVSIETTTPGKATLAYFGIKDKSVLWVLLWASFLSLGWILHKTQPKWLIPAAILVLLTLVYEKFIYPKFRRTIQTEPTSGGYLEELKDAVCADPMAEKTNYVESVAGKLDALLGYLPTLSESLYPFVETVMFNPSIQEKHLGNALGFLKKMKPDKQKSVGELFALFWADRVCSINEDGKARKKGMKEVMQRIDSIRQFVKKAPESIWNVSEIRKIAKALKVECDQAMAVIAIRPKIMRGLKKAPRPIFAWIVPTIVAAVLTGPLLVVPAIPPLIPFCGFWLIVIVGTCVVSTKSAIAPGVLTFEKTRRRLKEALDNAWTPGGIVATMAEAGIDVDAFNDARQYLNKEAGVRVEIQDRRNLEGALRFLTSSEEIGNCIALRHFVAWSLPSFLDDESVMLADVYSKGGNGWQQRAQIWLVAAQQNSQPVLVINSIELNDEGAKIEEKIYPEVIAAATDLAKRAGFKKLYVGISEFGRDWLDERYDQCKDATKITKIHHPQLSNRYYFDAFRFHPFASKEACWVYARKRSTMMRTYAMLFGVIEFMKGRKAKARAFFDSAKNVNNCWDVGLENEE